MNDYKSFLDDGIFDINSGKFTDAVDKITKSIELKNDWEISYFYRAVAFHSLEKYDDAILDYTKAIMINDKMTDAYYNRAKISLTRKDIDNIDMAKVVEDLEKALELDNNFLEAMYAIAAAHKKLGNYKVAVEYLDKLLEKEPCAVQASALRKLLLQKYIKE